MGDDNIGLNEESRKRGIRYTRINSRPVLFDWPDEADDILRTGWEAGRRAREIAAQLSGKYGGTITRMAVIGRAHRLNLPKRQQGFVKEKRKIAATPHYVPAPPPPKPPRREAACNPLDRAPLIDIPASESFAPVAARYPYRKTLLELSNTSCRWPLGEPGKDDFFFCGAPGADCDKWRPYCDLHSRTAVRR